MRFDDELNAARFKGFVNFFNVVNFVVDNRRGMIEIRSIRNAQHDADAATVKESHVRRRLKQKHHAENISIERNRAIQVFDVDENLSDSRQSRTNRNWRAHEMLLLMAEFLFV